MKFYKKIKILSIPTTSPLPTLLTLFVYATLLCMGETAIQDSPQQFTYPKTGTHDLVAIGINTPRKPKESPLNNQVIDDERTNYPATKNVLTPLKETESEFMHVMQQQFDYLNATRSLEVNTKRTEILEKIGKKMIEGQNKQIRIVIMNKC